MAKYTVRMSCGHEETVELYGKNIERERKIEYFQSSGLCNNCYKKYMEEKEKEQGLRFNGAILPYIDNKGNYLVYVWFSGNTKQYKDAIKSIGGYHWGTKDGDADILSTDYTMCWSKTITLDECEEEIAKAQSIGASTFSMDQGFIASTNYVIARRKKLRYEENQKQINQIPKPEIPDILKGCRWNRKIYGKQGNYSIYPNGEKVTISDEEAKVIETYIKAKEEYERKIEEIKNA